MTKYNVGDSVKISSLYANRYPEWNELIKDKPAIIVGKKSWKILSSNLGKEDKAMFQLTYGISAEYDLVELMVKIDGTEYEVSEFGISK